MTCVEKYYLVEGFCWGKEEAPQWFSDVIESGRIIIESVNDKLVLTFDNNTSQVGIGDYVVKKTSNFFYGIPAEVFKEKYIQIQV